MIWFYLQPYNGISSLDVLIDKNGNTALNRKILRNSGDAKIVSRNTAFDYAVLAVIEWNVRL